MYESNDEIFKSIKSFLIERYAFQENLTYETIINKAIDGDDALEFIEAFSKKYNVDMSKFEFDNYFAPEAVFNLAYSFFCLLFARHKLKRIPITVRDLVEIAKKHKWS
jgi:hypothetical protein